MHESPQRLEYESTYGPLIDAYVKDGVMDTESAKEIVSVPLFAFETIDRMPKSNDAESYRAAKLRRLVEWALSHERDLLSPAQMVPGVHSVKDPAPGGIPIQKRQTP